MNPQNEIALTVAATLTAAAHTCQKNDHAPNVTATLIDLANHFTAHANGECAPFTTSPESLTGEELGILSTYLLAGANAQTDEHHLAKNALIEMSFHALDFQQNKQTNERHTQ